MGLQLIPAIVSDINSFGDNTVWQFLIQIFILVTALLIGNLLRTKVPLLKKSLIPSSLIGGTLILILKFIPAVDEFIDYGTMEKLTYHCLAIGFIAMSLRKRKPESKTTLKPVLLSGVLQGAVYSMQASLGLLITIILSYATGFFAGGGILLALGFGQGTGQALNYGKIFENDYGFGGGTTFGLTIATIGFFVASIVGVVYMNILRKKGKLRIINSKEFVTEEKLEDYVTENEIPNTESIDKFSINIALVLFVYAIVYVIMKLVNVNLVWGFNFLLGSLLALLVRLVLDLLNKKQVFKRKVTNNFLLERISGTVFDVMIIAGIAAIDLKNISTMWLPILIICGVGTIATFIYIRIASKTLYKGYEDEGFFSMFGMLTGTASNGMILLREIDPKFETPASSNLVLSGLPAIVFGGALLILLGYCPKGLTEAIISCGIITAGWIVFTIIIFWSKIFKKKKKEETK